MSKHKRRRSLVDRRVQGALLFRVVLYVFYSQVSIVLIVACWFSVFDSSSHASPTVMGRIGQYLIPAIAAFLMLLPLILVDILRLSNRFAGPMWRLRRSMRALADGQDVAPLRFRDDDFWKEFADSFNALRERLRATEPSEAADSATSAREVAV